jgi:hypothetical protein
VGSDQLELAERKGGGGDDIVDARVGEDVRGSGLSTGAGHGLFLLLLVARSPRNNGRFFESLRSG